MMTPKPRSNYTDHTRKLRSGRRTAILNAAAARMGFASWQKFGTVIRTTMEGARTDDDLATDLRCLLAQLIIRIKDGDPHDPPADMQAILAAYPLRKAGRTRIVIP